MSTIRRVTSGSYMGYNYFIEQRPAHINKQDPLSALSIKLSGVIEISPECWLHKLLAKGRRPASLFLFGIVQRFYIQPSLETAGHYVLRITHEPHQSLYTHGITHMRGKLVSIINRLATKRYRAVVDKRLHRPDEADMEDGF